MVSRDSPKVDKMGSIPSAPANDLTGLMPVSLL
jgi:hypothetical protein